MELHADPEPEVIAPSTSDNVELQVPPYSGVVSPHRDASRRARNAKPSLKSFSFLPPLRRESFKTSGIRNIRIRKYWETKFRRRATEHTANNYYNYHVRVTGGFGGSGGEGLDQGGNAGAGYGPTIYFGQPQDREASGDINLIKEFKEMCSSPQSSVGGRQTPRATVRRVYTAKLEGRESGHMTVAMYEGNGAEETWNQHLVNYEAVRHPNIMQLYGLVRTNRLYAMVFHDELIPYAQFFRRFQHSPILSAYIKGYCITEFRVKAHVTECLWTVLISLHRWQKATNYISNLFPSMDYYSLPVWIRPPTGELCLDLVKGGSLTSKPPVRRGPHRPRPPALPATRCGHPPHASVLAGVANVRNRAHSREGVEKVIRHPHSDTHIYHDEVRHMAQ
ncbi:hypothetical protein MSAN_02272900 [Mycena sanguinolenta]|uniref:Uncharacterized protein n=1 Tax=Mycena sanguinolenta TaxID=230812 RepID=A0A8H6XAS0_9AGAR|nr:hypothetical protein MSAN_02272900 [Mycena sanguinolenta]